MGVNDPAQARGLVLRDGQKASPTTPLGSQRAVRNGLSEPDTLPLSLEEACDGMKALGNDFKTATEQFDQNMRNLLSRVPDKRKFVRALFRIWAEKDDEKADIITGNRYDRRMYETGHEPAINNLLHALVTIDRLGANTGSRIIYDRLVEMSCGTGTVIKLLAEQLPRRRLRRMEIIANDVSREMKDIARKKLEGVTNVDYKCHDAGELSIRSGVGTAILSQTLHLIANEEALLREMEGRSMPIGDVHTEEKRKVIENAFRLLRPGGTFIIIDEWPAMFSHSRTLCDWKDIVIEHLFERNFKPIDDDKLRETVMMRMHEARFVCRLRVPIWAPNGSTHWMEALVFRKDEDKPRNREKSLPPGERYERVRARARAEVRKWFGAIDEAFIESYAPPPTCSSEWVRMMPMRDERTFVYDKGATLARSTKYSTIVLPNRINNTPDSKLIEMIRDSIDSLRLGGALLFVEEWKPPEGSSNPIRKSAFRNDVMGQFSETVILPVGGVRIQIHPDYDSGMYGYLYRKVGELKK